MLGITAFALATIFFITSCKKDKKDDTETLLLAALLLNGGVAEFNLSNTNALAANRIATGASQFRVGPNNSGFLVDLGGDNPQNYGDGAADGFNDRFLTPGAVSMSVCQVLAYKSVAKGGPAVGSETVENANFVAFQLPSVAPPGMGDLGPCSGGAMVVALKGDKKGSMRIKTIPDAENYDRIGFIIKSFVYYFDPTNVPEKAYRYVELNLNPIAGNNLITQVARGDVNTDIWGNGCPASYANSASAFFPELLFEKGENPFGGTCIFEEALIDVSSGAFLTPPSHFHYITDPGSYLNAPTAPGVVYSEGQKLKFKTPASVNALAPTTPYILVVGLDSSKKGSGDLLFDISVDKVLFWDSTGADNIFSPQLDATDRPNATTGADNLATTSRKNLIFHLPTILGQTK